MADSYKDRELVARQLGREPLAFRVAARCPAGRPSVIENERRREMPTTFWITCRSLQAAISRIEAVGGVRQAQEEVGESAINEVHDAHLANYGARVAGVGGPMKSPDSDPDKEPVGSVKCLHAFTALHLSGALPNPVAKWTLARLEGPYLDPTRCPGCEEYLEQTE